MLGLGNRSVYIADLKSIQIGLLIYTPWRKQCQTYPPPPISLDAAGATRPMLEDIRNQLGAVPNIFSTFAHSPAVLKGFLAFNGALGSGVLAATVREKIALAIAGANQCDYCAFAHSVLAAAAGIDKPESAINLTGSSSDARTQAMLNFVLSVVAQHGEISPDELETLRCSPTISIM